MSRTGKPATRRVGAVSRALSVLDVLAERGTDVGTNELARETGINASTVSRILSTLADAGLVEHVESNGRYRLGVRLVQLGNVVLAHLDLRERARQQLEALVAATGETATLSIAAEREAVTVDFVRSPASVQSVAQIGRPSVAHATATGKVMLAFGDGRLPPGPLPVYTRRTIARRTTLAHEIERVRVEGWAQAVGEREDDLNALAAPVRGARGELSAIVGVQGPAGRFHRHAMRAAVPRVLDAAAGISARLGHTGVSSSRS